MKFAPDPGPTPDADLAEAVGRGDLHAFEELYDRYRDWVVRLAFRLTGNEAEAHDILQRAFARFLEETPRMPPYARLTTFLYSVVKELETTSSRAGGRTARGEAVPGPADTSDLGAALEALPAGDREVLLLHLVDGMSLEETAGALGFAGGTARARLRDAVARLRDDPRTRGYFDG